MARERRRSNDHEVQNSPRWQTVCERIKNKRPSNKMLPFGEKVVWMMPKDNFRRNKLDSIHQFGVFVGIVPRTGEFVVLTLEGTVAVRTVHSCSEDRKWDTELMSRLKGAPWDFKANARDNINDGGILESRRSSTRPTNWNSAPHQCEKNEHSQDGC